MINLWIFHFHLPLSLKLCIHQMYPAVGVAACCVAPAMSATVCRQLGKLHAALTAGDKQPFSSILEQYSHRIFRIGQCQLFPSDDCSVYRISDTHTACYITTLFERARDLAGATLSRFDLHHGHFFFNRKSALFGILFHTKEYPRFCSDIFPFCLGYCQQGSDVVLDSWDDMSLRTVLWVFGMEKMYLLDGSARKPLGTIYESEFGKAMADVYYFPGSFQPWQENLNRGLHVVPY